MPFAHQYLLTKPDRRRSVGPADDARPGPARVLPRARPAAAWSWGATSATPRRGPWTTDLPPTSTTSSFPTTGSGSSRSPRTRSALVPVLQTAEVVTMINGPEAFTPDGEFILGESDVRGFFVAAGFCAHGIAGAGGRRQGDGRLDRATASPSTTCGRWTSAGSARTIARATMRGSAPTRSTRPTTTSTTPAKSGKRAGRSRPHRRTADWRSSAPRSARSPAGSAPTGSRRTRIRRSRGCAREDGRASTGRARSRPSTRPRASAPRSSTSRASPRST